MYKNLSLIFKQAKNKRGANFFTKISKDSLKVKLEQINGLNSFSQNSFTKNTLSKKTFATGDHRFEKLAERTERSSGGPRQGKLNLRAALIKEPLNTILQFLSDNGSNMNDADQIDAIFLIAGKLEGDTFSRINIMNVEKHLAFQNLKKYILANFDKLLTESYASQSLLLFLAQLNLRNRVRSIFLPDQINKIVISNIQNLETNSSKMTLLTILNIITLSGMFRGFNPAPYLKEKNDDVNQLGFMNIYRLLRRISSSKESEIIRDVVSRFLIKEFLNMATTEKMGNKAKAFSIVSKIDYMSAYSSNHTKLLTLLKDIRSQAENHDQQSILNMIEGLIYFDDSSRGETLKEFYDIVTMTIRHQPENVKVDFVLRFLEHVSKFKNDNALTHEHFTAMLEYVLNDIQTNIEAGGRTPNSNQLIPIFTIMRKHKFFDKEIAEKLFKNIEPYIHKIQLNDHMKSFKFICNKVLGEEYVNKFENEIPALLLKDLENLSDAPLGRVMNLFNKAVFFAPKSPITNQISTQFLERIDSVLQNADINLIVNFANDYVTKIQEYLPLSFKLPIVEKILNKINLENLKDLRNSTKAISTLVEIVIPREREDLRNKQNEIIKILSEDERVRKTLVNYFQRISKDEEILISNATIYKFVNILREYSKNDEFFKDNEKILERLLNTAFNFLFNMDRDANVTNEAISSILSFIDFTHKNHPELTVEVNSLKATAYLRAFNQAHLSSTVLNVGLMEYLRRSKENERNYLSNDTITVIDKLTRSNEINQEDLQVLVRKFISGPEKAEELFGGMSNYGQKITLFKLYSNLNRKRYDVTPDSLLKKLKNNLFDNVIKSETNTNDNLKLQALFAMNSLKGNVLNYEEDSKEINSIIKSVFSTASARKIFRQVESLPVNNLYRFGKRLLSEFSQVFEKETTVDRFFLLKVLDRFTLMKYTQPSFYNKVIQEYETLFDNFTPSDHCDLVNYFARVELNKEDVLRASVKNINLRLMNESDKFNLWNSLVKLGFTNQEWKELILERLVKETDFTFALQKANLKERFQGLINLWKLGEYPSNHAELLDTFVSTINKFNKLKVNDKNLRNNVAMSEDWLFIVRRAPFFNKLDAELQSSLDTIFKGKVEKDMQGFMNKVLAEYLKAIGHTLEVSPTDKLCDFYLPSSKTAIVFARNNLTSIIGGELNQTGVFIVETLKKQGLNAVVITQQALGEQFNKENNGDVVAYLESVGVANLAKGKEDFAAVDGMRRASAERKVKRTQEAAATVESDDE